MNDNNENSSKKDNINSVKHEYANENDNGKDEGIWYKSFEKQMWYFYNFYLYFKFSLF